MSLATGLFSTPSRRVVNSRRSQHLNAASGPEPANGKIAQSEPVESLGLSTRARNALHQLGCHTVAEVMRFDYTPPLPRLGRKTRQEIQAALVTHRLMPPVTAPDPAALEHLTRRLTHLRQQLDQSMRSWQEQLANLEEKIRKLSDAP